MTSLEAQSLVQKLQGKWSAYLKLEYSVEFPESLVLSNAQAEAIQDIICKGLAIELDPLEQKGGQVIAGRLPGRAYILRRKAKEEDSMVYHAPFLSTSTVRRLFQKAYGSYSGSFYGQNREIFKWLLEHSSLNYLVMLSRPIAKGSHLTQQQKALAKDLFSEGEESLKRLRYVISALQRLVE